MKLLLMSNSTSSGGAYLGWPKEHIINFLKESDVKKVLFIPYAGAPADPDTNKAFDEYEQSVKSVFDEFGFELQSIHTFPDLIQAVNDAEAIAVGGGNTFYLVHLLHKLEVMDAIRENVLAGTPYMGWSAGANIACPTLRTTNDMPVIEPESFACLNLVPFQINPQYLDANPKGHAGETREQRITEFIRVNPSVRVLGLREVTLLKVSAGTMELVGDRTMRVFKYGEDPYEVDPSTNINNLLEG